MVHRLQSLPGTNFGSALSGILIWAVFYVNKENV